MGTGLSAAAIFNRLRAGGFNARPNIRIERGERHGRRERGQWLRAPGDEALRRGGYCASPQYGIGQGASPNHAGVAGVYAMMPLAHDMIGLYAAVGNANHMAPWGGTELLLSTNPIAVAIPSAKGTKPVLLDMATTVAAYGKVKLAAQRGETIPEGWMIDQDGNPLTDPSKAASGSLLPIGGPKGYGLALVLGLLAGTLNGAAMGRDVIDFNADDQSVTNTGQFIAAIDIASFIDVNTFKRQVARILGEMKSSALRPGFNEIRIPGNGRSIRDQRTSEGIPIAPALMEKLNAIAASCGVDPL